MDRNVTNAKLFILAVKDHAVLWKEELQATRATREKAWKKMLKIFYPEFHQLSQEKADQYCTQMKTAWSDLKDSYDNYRKCSKTSPKKRKPNYFDDLSFLDANFADSGIESVMNASQPNLTSENTSVDKTVLPSGMSTALHNMNVNPTKCKEIGTDENVSPIKGKQLKANEYFWFSLLPDLEQMNAGQLFDFKIGCMTLIREILGNENRGHPKITIHCENDDIRSIDGVTIIKETESTNKEGKDQNYSTAHKNDENEQNISNTVQTTKVEEHEIMNETEDSSVSTITVATIMKDLKPRASEQNTPGHLNTLAKTPSTSSVPVPPASRLHISNSKRATTRETIKEKENRSREKALEVIVIDEDTMDIGLTS